MLGLHILKYTQSASARGGSHGTALHSAASVAGAGHLQVARSPLRRGVRVDPRIMRTERYLQLASHSSRRGVVQCLIDHGADMDLHS